MTRSKDARSRPVVQASVRAASSMVAPHFVRGLPLTRNHKMHSLSRSSIRRIRISLCSRSLFSWPRDGLTDSPGGRKPSGRGFASRRRRWSGWRRSERAALELRERRRCAGGPRTARFIESFGLSTRDDALRQVLEFAPHGLSILVKASPALQERHHLARLWRQLPDRPCWTGSGNASG